MNCKTCGTCRFIKDNTCVKFGMTVNKKFSACQGYADTSLNESLDKQKIQLND